MHRKILSLMLVMLFLGLNQIAYASPSFTVQSIVDTYSIDYPEDYDLKFYENHLDIDSITYSSDGEFLNVMMVLHDEFDSSDLTIGNVSYGMLIDADSNKDTGIGGYEYKYDVAWTKNESWGSGKWIETYEQLTYSEKNPITFFQNEVDDIFTDPKVAKLSLDLSKINSPNTYTVIFFSELSGSTLLQDFTSLAVIPPPKFTLSFNPDPIMLYPGDDSIIILKINSDAKGNPDIYFSIDHDDMSNLQIIPKIESPITLVDGQGEIPLEIIVPKNFPPSYNKAHLKIDTYYQLPKNDVSIRNDLIKHSFYRNQPLMQELNFGIYINPTKPLDPAWFGIGAAIVASAVSAAGIIISARQTRKSNQITEKTLNETQESNDLLRLELIHKLRPLLKTHDESCKKISDDELEFAFYLSNNGKNVAKNIQYSVLYLNEYPSLNKIIKLESDFNFYDFDSVGNLLPEFHIEKTLTVKGDSVKKDNHWFVLIIEYDFLDDQHNEEIICLHFNNTKYFGMEHYDQSQISKARSDFRKSQKEKETK